MDKESLHNQANFRENDKSISQILVISTRRYSMGLPYGLSNTLRHVSIHDSL